MIAKGLTMRLLPLIAVVVMMLSTGCRTTSGDVTAATELKSASPTVVGSFIGCRSTAGECRHSCPENDGFAVESAAHCDPDDMEPIACFCPTAPVVQQPEPSDDTHTFVGCVPNAGECAHSCPTRKVQWLGGSERCAANGLEQGACFCEK